jgi:hypothetical protein
MEHVLKLPAFFNDSFDVFMRDLSAKNQTNNNKRPPPPSITQAPVFALQLKKVFFRSWYEFSPLEDPLKKRITFAIFFIGLRKNTKKTIKRLPLSKKPCNISKTKKSNV